jgi:hypothetical protein
MATPTPLPEDFSPGQVLTAANMDNLRGAFRILQVVESTPTTTLFTSTSLTFIDCGLSLTITPQSTSNKILCVYMANGFTSASITGLGLRVLRGASTVVGTDNDNCYSTNGGISNNITLYHFDAPATTSATTYKVQMNRNQGTGIAYVNAAGAGTMSRFFAMEISL